MVRNNATEPKLRKSGVISFYNTSDALINFECDPFEGIQKGG